MAYIRNGYIALYMPTHHRAFEDGMVYEHIVVAEQKIGRRLKDSEEVHHEDENRLNNQQDNLFIFATKSDHVRYHNTGVKVKVDDYYISPRIHKKSNCIICDNEFEYNPNSQTGKYCSTICSSKASRKSKRPEKDILLGLIKSKTFVEIGKDYGVTDNAVRKWCKSYGLPFKKKDIKNLLD